MPRKRDISPDLWRSEQFLELPTDTARLAFVAAFSLADDLGLGRIADLRRLTTIDVSALDAVAAAGLVTLYEVADGRDRVRLYFVPKWCRHQYVNRPTPSKLPLPADWQETVPEEFHDRYRGMRVATAVRERPVAAPSAHGGFTENSRRTHAADSEPHLSPSPSPSPSPEEKKNPAAVAAAPAPAARRGASVPPSAEGLALAEHLLGAVRSHSPAFKAPARLDGWARDLDLALRIDGRTPATVRAAIDFAHRDARGSFWRSNVLSGAALRKHFDRLAIAAGAPSAGPPTRAPDPRRTTAAEQMQLARAEAGIDGEPR